MESVGSVVTNGKIMDIVVQETKPGERVPYEILSEILDFEDRDHEEWWHNGAPALGRLMQWADYSLESQYRYLIFFYKHVATVLGPSAKNGVFWPANITSTGIPLELQVNYRQNKKPVVRLSIAPVSYLAGTERDPFNMIESWKFVNKMSRLNIDFDTKLFNHFANDLTVTKEEATKIRSEGLKGPPQKVQVNFGMDFNDGTVVKAYMLPTYKALVTGTPIATLVFASITKLENETNCAEAMGLIRNYVEANSLHKSLALFGWDCVHISRSRIKIYLVESHSTLSKLEDLYTLGGRLVDPTTRKGVELLTELWGLLGFDDGEENAFERAPLMCNYELKPGSPYPTPKLYIHTKGQNDLVMAQGFTKFFENHGCLDRGRSYPDSLRLISPDEDPSQTASLQSCISFSYSEKTGVYASIYYLHSAGKELETSDYWKK